MSSGRKKKAKNKKHLDCPQVHFLFSSSSLTIRTAASVSLLNHTFEYLGHHCLIISLTLHTEPRTSGMRDSRYIPQSHVCIPKRSNFLTYFQCCGILMWHRPYLQGSNSGCHLQGSLGKCVFFSGVSKAQSSSSHVCMWCVCLCMCGRMGGLQ